MMSGMDQLCFRPMGRRRFLQHALWLGMAAPASSMTGTDWPLWRAFGTAFIQADGRVIEHSAGGRSTSEGQAYAMFFALVANDRQRFTQLLGWTERNLAGHDLRRHLPAWLWGQSLLGNWKVLDANSATDADLWLAYALLEAGRLWGEPELRDLGLAVLARVRKLAVVTLPKFGPMLLPAPRGFSYSGGRWRINLSYLMAQQLRRFGEVDREGPWSALASAMPAMLKAIAPLGVVPDWAVYHDVHGWQLDRESKATASYDAVRSYLWTGMMSDADPLRMPLLEAQRGLLGHIDRVDGRLPEKIDALSGRATGTAPPGFSAALLPWLAAFGEADALAVQRHRLAAARQGELYGAASIYYDQVLAMFGLGWDEGRYRFDARGRLLPRWAA